jgi:predicted PurR-regulated permease PerM
MSINRIKIPSYARFCLIVVMIALILGFLYAGRAIIMPLFLSLLFALLLRPVVVFLNKKCRFPHVLAILFSIFVFLLLIASLIYFISSQTYSFLDDWPKLKKNLNDHYHHLQSWVQDRFNFSYKRQEKYMSSLAQDSIQQGKGLVGNTLLSFSELLFNMIVIPVYIFLILLYRNLFKQFLAALVDKSHHERLVDIVNHLKVVVQSYVMGLLIEMVSVATLTSIGYLIIGVSYAVLLGVITAVLNLIPYIGILCAGLVSIVAVLVDSTDLSKILLVIVVNMIVQFIDNNILIPKVVASKVRINALASIVVVIIGGAMGGVVGMFLAIPLLAMLKVIFDRIPGLAPWGLLIGDNLPKTFEWRKMKFPSLDVGNENGGTEKKENV